MEKVSASRRSTGETPEDEAGPDRRTWLSPLRQPTTLLFAVALVLGLALRMWLPWSQMFVLDADRAVVYLMSRHVALGELPAFYWGQPYGGTILQITAGVLMMVTGPSIKVLAFVSALYFMAAAVVLRQIVARSLGTPWGDLAGILMWFPLAVSTTVSIGDPGFYGPTLLIGLAILSLALGDRASDRSVVSWIVLGALCGLAVWTSPIAVAFAAPGVLVAVWKDRRWRRWLVAVVAALVCGAPWIIETLRTQFGSVKPLGGGSSFHAESFVTLFTMLLPTAVPLGSDPPASYVVAVLAVAALLGLLLFGIWRRNAAAAVVALSTGAVIVLLVVATGVRLAGDSVRYTTFLIPAFAFAAALLASRLRRVWLVPALALLAILGTIASLASHNGFVRSTSGPFDPSLMPVVSYLEDNGVSHAYGSYWLAYPMTAASEEKVTVAALLFRRYKGYEPLAAAQAPMAVIVYNGHENDKLLSTTPGLPASTRREIGGYTVYLFSASFDILALPVGLF